MTRANPILSSFNAGELSPLIGGRPDLARYQCGLSRCENFIPRVQGALVRRGGTRFTAEIKDSRTTARFIRFVYAVNDAYLLELGDPPAPGTPYIRFHRDRGALLVAPVVWDGATAYGPRDFVSHGGADYFCIAANTGVAPPDAGSWRGPGWETGTAYVEGDLAIRGGVTFYATAAGVGVDPSTVEDQAHWRAMANDPVSGRAIYEIPGVVSGSRLIDGKDGSFAVRYTQSGDVLYLAHPMSLPRKLIRRGALDWVIAPYDPDGGPFQDANADEDFTVAVAPDPDDGETLAVAVVAGHRVRITADRPLFKPGHAGALFLIQMRDGSEVRPWEVYQPIAVGEVRRSDGKYYRCVQVGPLATQFTGADKPIHTSGRYWDGDGRDVDDDSKGSLGAEWEYIHPGYGWVRLDAVADDGLSAIATVISRLPEELAAGTWRWALPAWSDHDGWPNATAFFRDRLVWSKGQTAWFSQAGDYGNFKARDFGEQLASSAFQVLVQSGQGDPIAWLAPTQRLLVGTGGSVHAIGEASSAGAFGAANARQEDQVMPGVGGLAPVFAGSVLYAESSGRIVNEAAFSAAVETYAATDLTVFAEHITASGLTAMAFQKQPHAIVWCVRTDGGLVGLTFNKDQQVIGWHRHPIGGDGAAVEHVCVIPSPALWRDGAVFAQAGARDDVWLLVRRTIAGVTRRYIEFVTPEYQAGDDPAVSGYADCHLIYDGAPSVHLTGLDHLEGCLVQIKADGAAHRDLTVIGGAVSLDAPAARAVVGLAAPARAMLMPLEAGAEIGTAQAQLKRIHRLTLRLVDSLGGAAGPDFATLQPLEYRWPHDRMDAPPPLMTGDMGLSFPGDYDGRATVAVECGQGFPFTLTAILPQLATYDV